MPLLASGRAQIDSLTVEFLHLLRIPVAGIGAAACGHAPTFRSDCSTIGAN